MLVRKFLNNIQLIEFDFTLPRELGGCVKVVDSLEIIAELSFYLVTISGNILWYIDNFYVSDFYQNRGIGTNLFKISIYEMIKISMIPIFTFLPMNLSLPKLEIIQVMNKVKHFLYKFNFIEVDNNECKLIKLIS